MRTAKNSYMIVKGADYSFEEFERKMILRNDIPCLIPFRIILSEGSEEYWYDVSGMQSLKNRFMLECIDGKQIRSLLESLLEMKSAMEEYLLDDANICFLPETVYYDRTGQQVRFCYIPGLSGQDMSGLRGFFEEILQHLNHADPSAVRMGYEMYERAARAAFTMQDCLDCIRMGEGVAADIPYKEIAQRDIRRKEEEADVNEYAEKDEDMDEMEFLFEEPEPRSGHRRRRKNADLGKEESSSREKRRNLESESGKERKKRRSRDKDRKDEEMLFAFRSEHGDYPEMHGAPADIGRTEVIREDNASKVWELSYKGDGTESDITISESPFLVGTDAGKVNCTLTARTVSRVHAKLYTEGDRLFVEDFNSTNGTYLNHNLLPMSTPEELKEGDRIVFATEEFAVYCRRTCFR